MPRFAILSLALGGCAEVDLRAAAMHEQLLRDNSVWMSRDPALLEDKYARMSAHLYDYYRGSAGWYYADLARPVGERAELPELQSSSGASLLLVGDAHPENLSTMVGGACPGPHDLSPLYNLELSFTLEIDDLDAATWGPWMLDLRRSALGLSALMAGLQGCDAACRARAVGALGAAYVDEVSRLSADEVPWTATNRGLATLADGSGYEVGALLDDVLSEAQSEGPADSRLESWTNPSATGELTLIRSWAADEAGRETVDLSAAEAEQVAVLWAGWAQTRAEPVRLLDTVRLYGMGVSSLPATRYLALIDLGSDLPEDDALLTFREVVDAPDLLGLDGASGLFADNAERIRVASERAWSRPDADGCATALMDGDQAFKVLSYSGWNQDIDRTEVEAGWADGDLVQADLEALGAALGRLVAGAHARGGTADGQEALPVLVAELGGLDADAPSQALGARLASLAEQDLALLAADHGRFQELLGAWGPLLGADHVQSDLE